MHINYHKPSETSTYLCAPEFQDVLWYFLGSAQSGPALAAAWPDEPDKKTKDSHSTFCGWVIPKWGEYWCTQHLNEPSREASGIQSQFTDAFVEHILFNASHGKLRRTLRRLSGSTRVIPDLLVCWRQTINHCLSGNILWETAQGFGAHRSLELATAKAHGALLGAFASKKCVRFAKRIFYIHCPLLGGEFGTRRYLRINPFKLRGPMGIAGIPSTNLDHPA